MSVSWSLSTTTSRFPGKTVQEIIAICQTAGLAGLEGGAPSFSGCTDTELETLAATYRQSGLRIETFHLPFSATDDLAAFYETQRRAAVRHTRYWMERAGILGATIGVAHPSTNRNSVTVEGIDPYFSALEKSLKELLPAAQELGFDLAFENMLPGDGERFGSRPAHFVTLRERFGHPRLKCCLDTGHALVALRERAGDFFEAMGSDLVAFHLQDTPGDRDIHLAPGHGRVDWNLVFRGMSRLDYRGTACIEAFPFDFGPDFSAQAWQRTVTEIHELAERALAGNPSND